MDKINCPKCKNGIDENDMILQHFGICYDCVTPEMWVEFRKEKGNFKKWIK